MRKVLIVGLDTKAYLRATETHERLQEFLPDHDIIVLEGVTHTVELSVPEKNGRD